MGKKVMPSRRSNADKRRTVMRLLEDEEWRQCSDREIARQCRVGHPLIAKLRSEMEASNVTGINSSERTYTTKHGTTATMNTGGLKGNGHIRALAMKLPSESSLN